MSEPNENSLLNVHRPVEGGVLASAAEGVAAVPMRRLGVPVTPPRTVFIRTWGCQMNEYDSQKMVDILRHHCQVTEVAEPEKADLMVMNTCSVREKAQEKVFSELGRWRKLKSERPELIIAVGGCVASQEGALLRKRAPWVDIVFGPQTLHRLPKMVNQVRRDQEPIVDISFPAVEKFDELVPAKRDGVTAYVSIMEGCSKYCSFCVVPYTRGREVSRPWLGVLSEIVELVQAGVKEVCLLGQNVNAWRGHDDQGEAVDFAWLLTLIEGVDGLERIRYTTSHPLEMSQSLIEVHGQLKKLMPFVHLPLQSGSDRILAAMKRGYTALEYKAIIRRLRRTNPKISLSSDFIVAFPGESEEDHRATMKLVEEIVYDHSYSFLYSPRPGTPAAGLAHQIDQPTGRRRLAELQALLAEQSRASRQALIGQEVALLIERRTEPTVGDHPMARGRTQCNRTVGLPDAPPDLESTVVKALVVGQSSDGLHGEYISQLESH